MTVRPYRDGDERAVIALWAEVLPDDAPHNDPTTVVRKKLAVGRDLFLIADDGSGVVGAVLGGYDGHRGWVYGLAVLPGRRREGIGTALVRGLERDLIARGCLKVNLQVRATNAEVVAFYERLGYTVEPRISMGRRLDS